MLYRSALFLSLLFCSLFGDAQKQYYLDIRKEDGKVLYAGYDNKIVVPENSVLTANGASIAKENDTCYVIKVPSSVLGKNIELTAKRGKEEWKRNIAVKVMPVPVIVLGSVALGSNLYLIKSTFLNLSKKDLSMGYPADSHIPFTAPLTAFTIELRVNGISKMKESVNGSKIPDSVLKLAQSLPTFEIIISEAKTDAFRVKLPEAKIVVK